MTAPRARRGVAGLTLAVGAVIAAGCGGDDAGISRDTFLERFSESSPGDAAFNECVVDTLFDQLGQDRMNSFYGEQGDVLSTENALAIRDASATCAAETAGITASTPPSTAAPSTTPG